MTEKSERDSLRETIYLHMQEKETEELIAIWQEDDHETWTQDAFDAVEAILLERLGELPEKNPPDLEEGLEENEEVLEFPADKKLIWIADLSNRLSWVVLGIAIILAVLRLFRYFFIPGSPPLSFSTWVQSGVLNHIIFIIEILDGALFSGFAFLVLQAISETIYLLIDLRTILQSEANGVYQAAENGFEEA